MTRPDARPRPHPATTHCLIVQQPRLGARTSGDVADEVAADMVVLAADAVHAKHVDANQLAEFVGCPLLVLP
jgi:hypothetical protein